MEFRKKEVKFRGSILPTPPLMKNFGTKDVSYLSTFSWCYEENRFHKFNVYSIGEDLNTNPGIYVLAVINHQRWIPLFVGMTDDLSKLRDEKRKTYKKALKIGATHVHVSTVHEYDLREEVFLGMIDFFEPPLNEKRFSAEAIQAIYLALKV